MRKIFTIALRDLYITYSDRNLLVIMLAAPLMIATIIGLAFGGLGGDAPIQDIPIAVVNLDQGGANVNFGALYADILTAAPTTPATSNTATCPSAASASSGDAAALDKLLNATVLTDSAAARAGVENGTYAAAVIIPADFTAKLGYGFNDPVEATQVEVYANPSSPVSGAVVRSIVESIGTQFAAGSISLQTTVETVSDQFGLLALPAFTASQSFQTAVTCAFNAAASAVRIEQQTVAGQKTNSTAAILVFFGSAQAMFFMLFTGQQGIVSIFEERRDGTLQRMLVSPTPRLFILLGKVAGALVSCVVQLLALFVALTLVGSLLSGHLVWLWGDNLLLLALVILAAAIASTGFGTLLAGLARTLDQANIIGQLFNLGMALVGGAFGFTVSETLSRFSLLYWGSNAFQKLAAGQSDIALNLVILLAFGLGLFSVGFWFFARRGDI